MLDRTDMFGQNQTATNVDNISLNSILGTKFRETGLTVGLRPPSHNLHITLSRINVEAAR